MYLFGEKKKMRMLTSALTQKMDGKEKINQKNIYGNF